MEDQSFIDSLISNKLFVKTLLFGFAIFTLYFIVNYLTSSDTSSGNSNNQNNIRDTNYDNTFNQQLQLTMKNKIKKRVCLAWKSGMKLEELKILSAKIVALNYDFYLIIRTDSNDIPSSKEKVKEFDELVTEKLIQSHVSLFLKYLYCTFTIKHIFIYMYINCLILKLHYNYN